MNKKEWHKQVPKQHRLLMLRTCNADGSSRNDFKWPKKGYVSCPDWDPRPVCGYGLHGLLRGEGYSDLLDWSPDALWLAVEVDDRSVVDLDGKVKAPCGYVVASGDRKTVTDLFVQEYPTVAVPGAQVTAGEGGNATAGEGGNATAGNYGNAMAGYGGTATAGDRGNATAGNRGNAMAGDYGSATAGYKGTATAGNYGNATAGHRGSATAGHEGTATAGNCGTATAGDYGTATAGDYGSATAGNYGNATAGHRGTATTGYYGTATAGEGGNATAGNYGILQIAYWCNKTSRRRVAVGYIGEDDLLPNVPYKYEPGAGFVRAE